MAGESPGRSDQQKSSGETARGESDPRLAISREAEAGQGSTAVAVVSDDLRSGSEEPESAPGGLGVTSEAEAEAEAETEPEAPAVDRGDAKVSGVRDSEQGEDSGTSEAKVEPKADGGGSDGSPKGARPGPTRSGKRTRTVRTAPMTPRAPTTLTTLMTRMPTRRLRARPKPGRTRAVTSRRSRRWISGRPSSVR
ncbi:hypothetical protein SVIO_064750 [Streptomyces violaceusniger]|uniref:Uncharacterized protein n=1 Tax=Streptomyces violaceusniger TaxID=68280 RepID=A0A4D4L402_STRVO|nr:hypothetical protein SVIO_064750 [Streptomyces violaceusniger]